MIILDGEVLNLFSSGGPDELLLNGGQFWIDENLHTRIKLHDDHDPGQEYNHKIIDKIAGVQPEKYLQVFIQEEDPPSPIADAFQLWQSAGTAATDPGCVYVKLRYGNEEHMWKLVDWENGPGGGGSSLPIGIEGDTIYHSATEWVAGSSIFNDGTNVTISATLFKVLYDMEIESGSLEITAGDLTLLSGDISVSNGNIEITFGDMRIDAGYHINFGDTIGDSGYGFRDDGLGIMQFKNLGGDWANIGGEYVPGYDFNICW